jgi:3-deoxy-7-phosphoheptulonate synthase
MPAEAQLRTPEGKPLPALGELEVLLPLDAPGAALVSRSRSDIASILSGRDDRLLVVVGPCSIHDPAAALEFARRLAVEARARAGDLMLVMRVYLEKPRTVSGWKGFVNDPDLDGSFDVCQGLHRSRELLLEVTRLGVPAATEFLDPIVGQFYADIVSLGVIGARTVESQVHRGLASGLPMPVAFKNRTDGDVAVAVDGMRAARSAHWLPTLTPAGAPSVRVTEGNERTLLVLRGGTRGPNYGAADVGAAADILRRHGLSAHLLVDCSHANSGKNPARQPAVAAAVAAQVRSGERAIAGVMLESNLVGGAQDAGVRPLAFGQSVTDGCLAWDLTVPVLEELAAAARARRTTRDSREARAAEAVAPAGAPGALTVLIADDEEPARDRLLAFLLRNPGFRVVAQCGTGTEALEAIRSLRPDIALLDMQMPGLDGLQVVTALAPDERPAIVFVTAYDRFAVEAFGVRAADYVLKPFDRQRLDLAIGRAAEVARARRERAAAPSTP